jgi:small subunit ribosomal protein S5
LQVVVGDEAGTVGVGCASASEVMGAVAKAKVDAKRNLVSVPLNKNSSFPHKVDGIFGAAKVRSRHRHIIGAPLGSRPV